MAFECPSCKIDSLNITLTLELPSDAQSDEITVQIVTCANCHFRGVAVYQESRRGALDSEAWHHDGYQVNAEAIEWLIKTIELCPSPGDSDCKCPAHISLGRVNERHYWDGLKGIEMEKHFIMHLKD